MCKENKKFEKNAICRSYPVFPEKTLIQNEKHLSSLDHIQWRQISYQEKKTYTSHSNCKYEYRGISCVLFKYLMTKISNFWIHNHPRSNCSKVF